MAQFIRDYVAYNPGLTREGLRAVLMQQPQFAERLQTRYGSHAFHHNMRRLIQSGELVADEDKRLRRGKRMRATTPKVSRDD